MFLASTKGCCLAICTTRGKVGMISLPFQVQYTWKLSTSLFTLARDTCHAHSQPKTPNDNQNFLGNRRKISLVKSSRSSTQLYLFSRPHFFLRATHPQTHISSSMQTQMILLRPILPAKGYALLQRKQKRNLPTSEVEIPVIIPDLFPRIRLEGFDMGSRCNISH